MKNDSKSDLPSSSLSNLKQQGLRVVLKPDYRRIQSNEVLWCTSYGVEKSEKSTSRSAMVATEMAPTIATAVDDEAKGAKKTKTTKKKVSAEKSNLNKTVLVKNKKALIRVKLDKKKERKKIDYALQPAPAQGEDKDIAVEHKLTLEKIKGGPRSYQLVKSNSIGKSSPAPKMSLSPRAETKKSKKPKEENAIKTKTLSATTDIEEANASSLSSAPKQKHIFNSFVKKTSAKEISTLVHNPKTSDWTVQIAEPKTAAQNEVMTTVIVNSTLDGVETLKGKKRVSTEDALHTTHVTKKTKKEDRVLKYPTEANHQLKKIPRKSFRNDFVDYLASDKVGLLSIQKHVKSMLANIEVQEKKQETLSKLKMEKDYIPKGLKGLAKQTHQLCHLHAIQPEGNLPESKLSAMMIRHVHGNLDKLLKHIKAQQRKNSDVGMMTPANNNNTTTIRSENTTPFIKSITPILRSVYKDARKSVQQSGMDGFLKIAAELDEALMEMQTTAAVYPATKQILETLKANVLQQAQLHEDMGKTKYTLQPPVHRKLTKLCSLYWGKHDEGHSQARGGGGHATSKKSMNQPPKNVKLTMKKKKNTHKKEMTLDLVEGKGEGEMDEENDDDDDDNNKKGGGGTPAGISEGDSMQSAHRLPEKGGGGAEAALLVLAAQASSVPSSSTTGGGEPSSPPATTTTTTTATVKTKLKTSIGVDYPSPSSVYGCFVCRKNDAPDKLLLCDNNCGREFHCYCLDPPLESVPEAKWFCPNCLAIENISDEIFKCSLPSCIHITATEYCHKHRCLWKDCTNRAGTSRYCTKHFSQFYSYQK